MRIHALSFLALLSLVGLTLTGCDGSNSDRITPMATIRTYDVWQNPSLSSNPNNNIHCDSYLTDSYDFSGPTTVLNPTVSQVSLATIRDPATGESRKIVLGECAAQAFDAEGNIQTICAGVPGPGATSYERYVATIDRSTLQVLAVYPFIKDVTPGEQFSFGGAGYFYQDNQYRMVVAMPDGHLLILRRTPGIAGATDGYRIDADYDVTGSIKAQGYPKTLDLYAVVPDKDGNIWFTTSQAVVGTIAPDGTIRWIDLNDRNLAGNQPVAAGELQEITNSHAVDEGDHAASSSGAYMLTTHRLYRLGAGEDGTPAIAWFSDYDRGTQKKSGQVSQGSGTSPTLFRMGNRRFAAIADNAEYMNINVYRAEINLLPGELRLFAQATPFGENEEVSNENSLIAASGADGESADIYTENNFGNDTFDSTAGSATTGPGFARLHLKSDGTMTIASVNNNISVPSVVSKISLPANTVYTYNKTGDGWYLTGLDADDLNYVRFTTKIGPGIMPYNNFYAGLSLDDDGNTVWIGTLFGLTRIHLSGSGSNGESELSAARPWRVDDANAPGVVYPPDSTPMSFIAKQMGYNYSSTITLDRAASTFLERGEFDITEYRNGFDPSGDPGYVAGSTASSDGYRLIGDFSITGSISDQGAKIERGTINIYFDLTPDNGLRNKDIIIGAAGHLLSGGAVQATSSVLGSFDAIYDDFTLTAEGTRYWQAVHPFYRNLDFYGDVLTAKPNADDPLNSFDTTGVGGAYFVKNQGI